MRRLHDVGLAVGEGDAVGHENAVDEVLVVVVGEVANQDAVDDKVDVPEAAFALFDFAGEHAPVDAAEGVVEEDYFVPVEGVEGADFLVEPVAVVGAVEAGDVHAFPGEARAESRDRVYGRGHIGGLGVAEDVVNLRAGVGGEAVRADLDVVPSQTVEQLRDTLRAGRTAVVEPVVNELLRAAHVLVTGAASAQKRRQRTACVRNAAVDRRVAVPEVLKVSEGLRLLDVEGEVAHADTPHPVLRHDEVLVCNLLPDGVDVTGVLVELLLIAADEGVELCAEEAFVLLRALVYSVHSLRENAVEEAVVPAPQTGDVPVAHGVLKGRAEVVGVHDLPVVHGEGVGFEEAPEAHAGL